MHEFLLTSQPSNSIIKGKGENVMSMNQDDITKYKSLYLQTSWGYLNMLRKNVAFLLKGGKNETALDAAHLSAHSLKSQSILNGI